MTIIDIENYLKDQIKDSIIGCKRKNKLGQLTDISVMTGLLPPQNYYKAINEYPFILIRNYKSDDDRANRSSTQNFKLYIGICAEEENKRQDNANFDISNYQEGHKELTSLYEKIRLQLLEYPFFGTNGFVCQIKKISFELFLEQPFPYFIAQVDIFLETTLPMEVIDFGN